MVDISNQRVAIIACTKQKRRGTWPAIQLYDPSDLFQKSVELAHDAGLPILVLSTKYGLVRSNEKLTFYEQPLETMTPKQRQSLDVTVSRQISSLRAEMNFSETVLLMGKNYWQMIAPILDDVSIGHRVHPAWPDLTKRVFRR